jgi:LysM repeat protein
MKLATLLSVVAISLSVITTIAPATTSAATDKSSDDSKSEKQKDDQKPKPVIVTVQSGDYLEKIATEHNSTSLRMFYANTGIVNPDLIHPSEQLRVPAPDETLTPRPVPANKTIAPTAAPVTAPTTVSAANYAPSDGSVWDRLAACEAGGNWAANTGNGYYGGLQFTLSTWRSLGGSGLPSQASREEQISRASALQARSGWGQWPACTAKLGLR